MYWGLGRAARSAGRLADAFRPHGAFDPLNPTNRFLRLPATFEAAHGGFSAANWFGEVTWFGIFDASYTRPGDYIVLGSRRYFIASQEPLCPVLCVLTNRTISVSRPGVQTNVAANPYGGFTAADAVTLMERWPASVLAERKSGATKTGLPTDQTASYLDILLPSCPDVILSLGDLVSDDLGRTATVNGSELTELGWRLSAKLATT